MKQKALYLIIAFWILFFAGLVTMHENRLRTGEEVILQTAPVDPRDFFRGDYVILNYDISRIAPSEFGQPIENFFDGQRIYLSLTPNDEGIFEATTLNLRKPKNELFITGRIDYVDEYSQVLRVEYGIESYFVPENTGKEIEEVRGEMKVKVRIDKNGNAAIDELLLEE